MCIPRLLVFDCGIWLYDLNILLGRGFNLPLFSVFMTRVLLEYAYFLCIICFQYKSSTKTSYPVYWSELKQKLLRV